ncbi:MAG: KpsF/GutQ family sugar-phosphate isomerase [Peptostreptococcaceae bacterium]|uniref:KpsF/GutQ family sugar-phosphate isomerase n=1 Tax=uncultured Cetobacterium sp. TaxID=527638 RepID=UPI0025E853CC|nr:KpsF/GutQ family sugar-phosphate isomerase [uncultured Cetobacterium sp.]
MEDIIRLGKEIFQVEISELQRLGNSLDENFKNVIEILLNTKGKVVVCGIGKSGLIGKKIAATLMSTGTSAVFLNAAEASHGDLGMINSEDIVLLISNSGTSSEVISILPSLKIIGCIVIALTGNLDSTLAKESHYKLYTGVTKEVCPLNIAPTSSTTALLLIGDAIAITLMKLKNFKSENFAVFHPGGALGRRLLTKIEDIMIPISNLPLITEETPIFKIIEKLAKTRVGAVLIVDSKNLSKLIGIITDGDLKRFLIKQDSFFSLKAKDMMTVNPKIVFSYEKAYDALQKMEIEEFQISFLPVLNEQFCLVGGLRIHDLLKIK